MRIDTSVKNLATSSATCAPESFNTSAPTELRPLNLSRVLLSVTASPGVRAVNLTFNDRILAVHLYAKTAYMAAVARGVECAINDKELKHVAWLLTRLMDRLGAAVRSRYYTYTGPVEVSNDAVRYRPYISPTSTAEVVLSGGTAKVVAGDYRKRFRTSVDVAGMLRRYLEYLEKC